jgi:hypothetical protein
MRSIILENVSQYHKIVTHHVGTKLLKKKKKEKKKSIGMSSIFFFEGKRLLHNIHLSFFLIINHMHCCTQVVQISLHNSFYFISHNQFLMLL